MGFSYETHNYCASGCGADKGWWPKRMMLEVSLGVFAEQGLIHDLLAGPLSADLPPK